MKKWIFQLFCRHDFIQSGWFESSDGNIRFSMRRYRCKHCGKEIWRDGRTDGKRNGYIPTRRITKEGNR